MNAIRYMYKIDFFDFQNKRFEKNGSKYICFFSTKRLFIINFRSEVTLSDSNPYPGRTVIRQIVPRPYRGLQTGTTAPESRCWWRRLPLRSPLACNQRDTESPLYFFWLTTCCGNLYFPNGWLSIWGSIFSSEMALNLGYMEPCLPPLKAYIIPDICHFFYTSKILENKIYT